MADKHLERRPHHQRGEQDWWWYEEPQGIAVVVKGTSSACTRVVDIPWRSLRAALRRKDRDD